MYRKSFCNVVVKKSTDSYNVNDNVDIVMVIDMDGFFKKEEQIVEPKILHMPVEFWFNNNAGLALPILYHNHTHMLISDPTAGLAYST